MSSNSFTMKLIVALPMALVLGSLVSAFPSNPRTNNFASSNQYSPQDDARMYENRGLQFEGPRSHSTDTNKNPNFPNGGGRPQNFPQGFPSNPNNNINGQPSGGWPQNNPQALPPSNGDYRPGGGAAPSFPGIRPHQATMNSNVRPRPPLSGFPGNPSGYPNGPSSDSNQPIEVKPAFEGCERHDNSVNAQQTGGRYETLPAPMKHNSHIALYPMTDDNHALYVKVMMPTMQYKAKIQGTNVKLEKCHATGVGCKIEDEASTKSNNLIQPQQWNYMYSKIRDGKITIGIGPVTKVMTMSNIPEQDLDSAEWLISSGDGGRPSEADGQGTNGGPFVVQFPCAEYVAQHFASTELPLDPSKGDDSYTGGPGYTAPHVGYTTEPTKNGSDGHTDEEDHTAAIVVGVVVALLIVALVVAIAISIYRKRNNFKVNESTPLSDQKKAAATSQEPQQSQQQEVELHDEK